MPLNAATAFAKQYTGAHGNASRAHLFGIVAAAPINETLVLGTFDPGTVIDEIRINHTALGASTSFDLGLQFLDGSAAQPQVFGAGLSSVAAGVKRYEQAPVALESRAQIIATFKGGPATGRIDLLADMRFVGFAHKLAG